METEDSDPDPGGIQRSLFYALWPRFISDGDEDEPASAEFSASVEE